MKKSRIFMGIAALSLVVAGVFANKTAKKFTTFSTLYYGGSYVAFNPGCLHTAFTAWVSGTGQPAKIKLGTGTPVTLYYATGTIPARAPVRNKTF